MSKYWTPERRKRWEDEQFSELKKKLWDSQAKYSIAEVYFGFAGSALLSDDTISRQNRYNALHAHFQGLGDPRTREEYMDGSRRQVVEEGRDRLVYEERKRHKEWYEINRIRMSMDREPTFPVTWDPTKLGYAGEELEVKRRWMKVKRKVEEVLKLIAEEARLRRQLESRWRKAMDDKQKIFESQRLEPFPTRAENAIIIPLALNTPIPYDSDDFKRILSIQSRLKVDPHLCNTTTFTGTVANNDPNQTLALFFLNRLYTMLEQRMVEQRRILGYMDEEDRRIEGWMFSAPRRADVLERMANEDRRPFGVPEGARVRDINGFFVPAQTDRLGRWIFPGRSIGYPATTPRNENRRSLNWFGL